MLLALHLHEFLHRHNVAALLDIGGWAAMSGWQAGEYLLL